ncbi:unnamed protein product [Paramecium sonneborni]|uniref:Uncharacterized protein n=1 Tax=Paramecium sonneborni TaxID=65129 RepID=A0A8S1RWG2_9CILI|nr:unnamed protein product [Paramecium sonneborni]
MNKGDTLKKLNRFEEALQYYDIAIEKNPEQADIYNNKALTFEQLNRLEEALQYYDFAMNKANTLKNLNRLEDALLYYDYAIQKKPKVSDKLNLKSDYFTTEYHSNI